MGGYTPVVSGAVVAVCGTEHWSSGLCPGGRLEGIILPVPEQGANGVVRCLAETRGIRNPRLVSVVQTDRPLVDRDFDALPGFGGLREGGEGADTRGREELGDAQ